MVNVPVNLKMRLIREEQPAEELRIAGSQVELRCGVNNAKLKIHRSQLLNVLKLVGMKFCILKREREKVR